MSRKNKYSTENEIMRRNIINVNIRQFAEKFINECIYLYNNDEKGIYTAGYEEAIIAFDEFFNNHREFVEDFGRYIGVYAFNCRAAAAFMFALDSLT